MFTPPEYRQPIAMQYKDKEVRITNITILDPDCSIYHTAIYYATLSSHLSKHVLMKMRTLATRRQTRVAILQNDSICTKCKRHYLDRFSGLLLPRNTTLSLTNSDKTSSSIHNIEPRQTHTLHVSHAREPKSDHNNQIAQ